MNSQQLNEFLNRHKLDPGQLAALLGLTSMAIDHWLHARRTIAKPYARLLRLFDKRPELMLEFK